MDKNGAKLAWYHKHFQHRHCPKKLYEKANKKKLMHWELQKSTKTDEGVLQSEPILIKVFRNLKYIFQFRYGFEEP